MGLNSFNPKPRKTYDLYGMTCVNRTTGHEVIVHFEALHPLDAARQAKSWCPDGYVIKGGEITLIVPVYR